MMFVPMGDRVNAANMDSDDNDDDDDIMVGDAEAESHDEYDDEEEENDDEDEESEDIVIEDETVEIFTRTFHNGDYDQEFDTGLSIDQSVHLPVRPTQTLYNKPDDWRERNRIGLEIVKEQLQNYIDSAMNKKSFNLNLTHNGAEPIVWHEPVLDEYWNKLEANIDRVSFYDIHIENVEIKKENIAALVDICLSGSATNSSVDVKFINANLCEEGIVSLSKLIEVCSKLHYFYIYHNRIDNMESARCLSRSLRLHSCITGLHLNHCDLGSSPDVLSVILQSNVKSINLDNNNIDSLGAVKIAEYLEGDPPIHRIDIDHNRLNDDDAILISQALKRNTNLAVLYIQSNNFTSIGVKALLTCIFDSSSLNAIAESNHTLASIIMFYSQESGIYSSDTFKRLDGCIDRLLDLDWTQKIMLALQDKESLLKYLANIPVELIPKVLAFPFQQDIDQRQHRHLNILYFTMRWWNMPMLYSYHNYVKSDTKRKRDD
jgi:hypothetical protein